MAPAETSSDEHSLHWPTVAAVYAALLLGLAGLIYWGDYRNAVWLGLIGTGGACTAYSRMLETQGHVDAAQRWQWASAIVYAIFFLWAGTVFIQTL